MPGYLEPVVQEFIAQADRYIGPVETMARVTDTAREAADRLVLAVEGLDRAIAGVDAGRLVLALEGVAARGTDARDALAGLSVAMNGLEAAGTALRLGLLRDALADVRTAARGASAAAGGFTRSLGNLRTRAFEVYAGLTVLDKELDKKKDALLAAGLAAAAFAAGMNFLAGKTTVSTAATRTGTVAAARFGRFWFLNGKILHWVVMGTLEIAATAIPALVALGAAAAGLYPTFSHIFDRMQGLVTASGGLRGALLNSVGPLHQLGVNMGIVTQKMAPDAYIIFGAVINGLAGHFSAFSSVAQQAGKVLADFATKLSAELSGPLGTKLAGFFANAVKYMTEWGQVLGNLSHALTNVAAAMLGAGGVLLSVLVALSRAFLVITNNPVAAKLIGIAAAFSAVYRYGKLVLWLWKALWGSALVSGIRTIVTEIYAAVVATGTWSAAVTVLRANLMLMWASSGPVLIAIAALALGMLVWYATVHQTTDAVSKLIATVDKAPPTLANLTAGINRFVAAAMHTGHVIQLAGPIQVFVDDLNKLKAAITRDANELVNLVTGLSQTGLRAGAVGAGMKAMAIQTALADSKVQQLNQALDAYMQLVTGGTGAMAAFSQSLANIGQVAGTAAHNLGTATSMSILSARQFSKALTSYVGQGAGAWTNFDQVVGSAMPALMDWFREASTLGAATGRTVTKAALDMAASMVKYAGSNKTAQATLLGFVRSQGLNIRTWGDLLKAIHRQNAGQSDLAKKVNASTIALSHLSQMAQAAGAALNQQVTSAIAAAALSSTQFTTDLNNAMQSLQTRVPVAGHTAQYWFAAMNTQLQLAQQRSTAAADAATAAGGKIAAAAGVTAKAWAAAKAQAQAYQQFLNSMHGKTITNIVNWVQHGIPQSGGGPGPHPVAGLPGPALAFGGGGHVTIIHQHVHGSVLTEQQVTRSLQGAYNRKTFRNGSTQLYLPGRSH